MNNRVLFCLLAILAARASDAAACKYTVRDVGFVDLGSKPYRLFISLSDETDESAESVATELEVSLLETNVIGSVLSATGADPSDDAAMLAAVRQFLDRQEVSRRPIGVLVSPDERMRLIGPRGDDNGEGNQPVAKAIRSIGRTAATSPLREQIAGELLSAHSVVLLAEGNDAAQNQAARDLANESIEHIARSLKSLPKPIANPPKLVVVSQDQAAEEAVFLWSLGVPSEEPGAAHLVALFGRLRKMGDVLAVPGATARDLSGFLYFVGQDCECELDRSVMQGMMAPHLWDSRLEADAAKALGFDPGHAVVKIEMSRILARGFSSGRRNLGVGVGGSPFDRRGALGYEEIEIEVLDDEDVDEEEAVGGGQETIAASQSKIGRGGRLAGRSTIATDPIETRRQETGDSSRDLTSRRTDDAGQLKEESAADEETAPSVATSLGVTVAAVAVVVLVLSAVVLLRARGGP